MKLNELLNELLAMTISNPMVREMIWTEIERVAMGNPIVILQGDAEGNESRPLSGAEPAFYRPDTAWRGEVIAAEDLENHDPLSIVPCIVLWPRG